MPVGYFYWDMTPVMLSSGDEQRGEAAGEGDQGGAGGDVLRRGGQGRDDWISHNIVTGGGNVTDPDQ